MTSQMGLNDDVDSGGSIEKRDSRGGMRRQVVLYCLRAN